MSKKSLLYIIIIICVLTSGFFLASNYRSSIEMENRGENIVPSVKGVEDVKQPQIEFIIHLDPNDSCTEDPAGPYWCGEEGIGGFCCDAQTFCQDYKHGYYNGDTCYNDYQDYCLNGRHGYYNDGTCYNDYQDYCENGRHGYFNGGTCYENQAEYCRTLPLTPDFNGTTCICSSGLYDNDGSGQRCVSQCPTDRPYNNGGNCTDTCPNFIGVDGKICVPSCDLRVGNRCVSQCPTQAPYNDGGECKNSCGNKFISEDRKTCVTSCDLRVGNQCVGNCPSESPFITGGVCYNESQCRSQFNGQGYPNGTTCHSSQLAYCKTINPSYDIVFENNCYIKNSDSYCLAARGTHYSGGSCRTNADECVALENQGAEYKGSPDEKYTPSKCDSVADKCHRDGKVLYGGKCITYQQKCEEVSKGTWKNGTCVTNNNGGNGVSGKTSNKDKKDNPKTDDVIGTDASLSDIVLSSGRLMFDFGTSDYRVEVSSNVESITI